MVGMSKGWMRVACCSGGGWLVCYLRCSVGVSLSTWYHTWGSWNFPRFLFKEGSLTLMYIASFMFLAMPCASLSTIEKHSGLTGCPVEEVCRCIGEGALRCSLYLSPKVLPDYPIYSSVQFIVGHLCLQMTPLLANLGSLSLGAIRSCLIVLVPLKCTWKHCLLRVLLNFSPKP